MLILETERLILREFTPADVDDLARTLTDRENMRFYPDAFQLADVEEWIERSRRRYATEGTGLWAVVLKETSELIGDCGLVRQTVDGIEELEIGYHLERAHQGHGYATEAARACRDYGFQKLGRSRLISLIQPAHTRSRRVAERNGLFIEKETTFHGLRHLVYVAVSM
jgi:RimJ/RimL family protein N-acetyltransferase